MIFHKKRFIIVLYILHLLLLYLGSDGAFLVTLLQYLEVDDMAVRGAVY